MTAQSLIVDRHGRPFAAAPQSARSSYTGIPKWDSLSPGEYNAALAGPKALETFAKMRRSGGQVAAVEAIISLPVRAVNWTVEPAGDGRADAEAAELIETNLLHGMEVTWDDFLRQQLLSVMLGFSIHEKVFTSDGPYVRWRTMADIPQAMITEFHYGLLGEVVAVVQEGSDSSGNYRRETLDATNLLITTYRKEGGNAAGFPLLRQMYMHWFIKEFVYRITNIGIENNLLGLTIAKVPRGMAQTQRDELLKMIEAIRVRDRTGVVIDEDVLLEILEGKRSPIDALPYIEHHDVMIARTALAQFLNLGTTKGALSLSEDHSKLFMLAEQTIADGLADNLNRHAIPQLCAFNWPGMTEFPKLRHDHPRTVLNLDSVGNALAQLVQTGLVTPDRDVEERIRELFDLPPLPPAAAPPDKPAKPDPGADAGDETPPDDDPPSGKPPKSRPPTAKSTAPGRTAAFAPDSGGADTPVRHPQTFSVPDAASLSGGADTPVRHSQTFAPAVASGTPDMQTAGGLTVAPGSGGADTPVRHPQTFAVPDAASLSGGADTPVRHSQTSAPAVASGTPDMQTADGLTVAPGSGGADTPVRHPQTFAVPDASLSGGADTPVRHPQTFAVPDAASVAPVGALFDQLDDAFQTTARPLLDAMVARLETLAKPLLDKLDKTQPLARARVYPALAAVELPGRVNYTRAVRDYLLALAEAGRQAAAEVTGEAAPAMDRDLQSFVTNQAELLADRQLADLKSVFCQQVLDGAAGNVSVQQAVSDAAQASRDRVNAGFAGLYRDALRAMADHLGEAQI